MKRKKENAQNARPHSLKGGQLGKYKKKRICEMDYFYFRIDCCCATGSVGWSSLFVLGTVRSLKFVYYDSYHS